MVGKGTRVFPKQTVRRRTRRLMQAMQVFIPGKHGYEAIPSSDDEALEGFDYTSGMEQSFRRKRPRPWRTYAAVGMSALGLAAAVGVMGHRGSGAESSYTQSSSDVVRQRRSLSNTSSILHQRDIYFPFLLPPSFPTASRTLVTRPTSDTPESFMCRRHGRQRVFGMPPSTSIYPMNTRQSPRCTRGVLWSHTAPPRLQR